MTFIYLKSHRRELLKNALRVIFVMPVALFFGIHVAMLSKWADRAAPVPKDLLYRDFIGALQMSLIAVPAVLIHLIWLQWDIFRQMKLEKNADKPKSRSHEIR